MSTPAHALVLTAGLGVRLRPLTLVRAKPAIPVAGEPLVRRIIAWLASEGVMNVTLNLHHLPHTLTAAVGDGSDLGARIRYSWELPEILGSAGGPARALDIIDASPFFIVNGDTLTDITLEALAQAHKASGALVTLALVPNTAPDRYGGVRLDAGGAYIGVVPRGTSAADSFHFIGVQIADRRAFASLPRGKAARSIGGVYDLLQTQHPGCVRGFVTRAQFWDIGTIADYRRTSTGLRSTGSPQWGATARIAASSSVSNSIVWDHVTIGDHAIVDECIVTDGVQVQPGAHHTRSILLRAPDGSAIAVPLPADES